LAEAIEFRAVGKRTLGEWAAFLSLNIWFYGVGIAFSFFWVSICGVWVTIVLATTWSRRKTQYVVRRAISWYGWVIIRLPWPWARFKFVDYEPGVKGPFGRVESSVVIGRLLGCGIAD